jgi:predicted TIM-barrel fold metal-dependent hydrolase
MMTPQDRVKNFMAIDDEWLETGAEDAIEPDLEIIDPHHHMFVSRPFPYTVEHVLADTMSGHRVRATVYVEAERDMYRTSGPEEFKSVGETEFAHDAAVVTANRDQPQVCAKIISHVDLTGPNAGEVLARHESAGGARFAGVRVHGYRDETGIMSHKPGEHALLQTDFQAGFKILHDRGLVCDIIAFHPQLSDVASLASAFPDTKIIVNHTGGPLGIGPYAGKREAVHDVWMSALHELAERSNVYLKLGGIANRYTTGISFRGQDTAPSSDQLAEAFAPYLLPALQVFGAQRCMFESDFPMERLTCSYVNLWNAFKKLTTSMNADERRAIFSGTAAEAYGVDSLRSPE